MSEINTQVLINGQLAVATVAQSGNIISEPSETDETCIVEDSNGNRYNAVKIVNFDDEPTTQSEICAQVLNNNNELITVTEEQEGEIIPQSNSQINFHCLVQKDEGEQLSVKTVELEGEIIKTGGAIDTTCIVQGSNGKKQLAVKVFKRGGGEIIETVSGNGSITLPKAKANGLKSVKLFGGCEQSGTPTPTTPQGIVSNNGVLKYSLNELNPSEIEIGYYRVQATGVLTESPYNFVTGYMPVKPNQSYVFFGRRIEDNRLSSYNRIHWFDANKEFISTNSYTVNRIGTGIAPANAYFAQCSCNESGSTVTATTQEIVDGYNWIFQQGNSEPAYIPYVEGGIYTDGTVETVMLTGKNLFDKSTALLGDIATNGSYTSRTYRVVSDYIPVRFGQTFVGSGTLRDTDGVNYGANVIKAFYKADKSYIAGSRGSVTGAFTINDNECAYIRIVFFNQSLVAGKTVSIENSVLQLEIGSSATPYAPYYNGGTATAEMLLKVGDYKDTQEILAGNVTRNVGIKVFDGTETFTRSSSGAMITAISDVKIGAENVPINTHFALETSATSIATGTQRFGANGTQIYSANYYMKPLTTMTVSDFKQFLADQYNAGTPVIVVYPLATPTTETVTPQTLQVQAGTNTLQITQASIDNLPLEATYKRGK